MRRGWRFGIAAAAMLLAAGDAAVAGPKVYSLDQCADQFVLALAPRADIVALSHRVDDADSHLRAFAKGLPRHRAALEPVLAAKTEIAIRYWGGDAMLTRALERRGIRVVTLDDATDFDGVRANVRKTAAALGRSRRGEALITRMDLRLRDAAGAGRGRPALYMTSGGFTAGPETLIGAMLSAAGLRNLAPRGSYAPAPLERLAMSPPAALVLGYFDVRALATQRWAFGRHQLVQRRVRRDTLARLPSSVLGCPAWFAADGAALLAQAARR